MRNFWTEFSLAIRALVVIAITIAVCATTADTPLPPPAKVSVMNPNRRFRAVSDHECWHPSRGRGATKSALVFPHWYGHLFVADDGKHLVTQYDGLNLLPTNFMNDLVLLAFWREGKKLRDVRVRDFVPDHHFLGQTASYYHWGKVDGFDAQGRLKVERADGKIFLFECHHRKAHRSLTNERSEPLRLFLLANPKFQMNGTFGNVYEHGEWARAYATLEVPGRYYLAFGDLPALIRRYDHGSRALDFGCAPVDRLDYLEISD